MPEVPARSGRDELNLPLPGHWTVEQVAEAALGAAPADWLERLAIALSRPGTGLPLAKLLAARRPGRIVLVAEDVTRRSPLPEILEVVMREIRHAGIRPEELEIVFATGMHPPMTDRQAAAKLGPAAKEIPWRCNPWHDPGAYTFVGRAGKVDVLMDRGVAAADLRILISSVEPHLQAGFGGGYKMLVPGCCALDTIRCLHRIGVGRKARQLVGRDASANRMRAVIDAGGQLVDEAGGKTFAVQYLLGDDNLPAFIGAGEVLPTHRMVAKQCSVACGIVTGAPADVLVTRAYPLDFDLWQSFKCIANTRWAVRPNGVIICLTRCPSGLNGVDPPPWPLSPRWTRRLIRWLGPEAIGSMVTRLVPRLAGDAAFFVRLALQALYRNPILIVSPALRESVGHFPGLELFGAAEEAIAAADDSLGGGPQRVVVFPAGGTTFPVPAHLPAGPEPARAEQGAGV